MRRLVASLFGRKDDKQQRKETGVAPKPPPRAVSSLKLRPVHESLPSNSSASSSTSFSVSTPDDGQPPSLPSPDHSRRWKSVFRNRKGSLSSNSLVRKPSALANIEDKYVVPVPHSRSSMMVRAASSVTDDYEDLSPPVRPFVRHRSSRSSEPSSGSNTNSPRSSRSSLVPPLPPIPASPPPLTPYAHMHNVILRSLSRNPYMSPHPLLTTPTSNTISTASNLVSSSDFSLYPRSVNTPSTLPPPLLTLPQQLARLRLFERLKTYAFSPAEERAISRASSLSRLSSLQPSINTGLPRQASTLRITSDRDSLQEVEAKRIHNVDRTGVSRGLARWVQRGGFEERCVVWTIDEGRRSYVAALIQGGPVAALEFSEGMEAFAGLVYGDETVSPAYPRLPESTARSSSASTLSPYNIPNDRLTTSTTLSFSTPTSSGCSGVPSTPSLSPTPSSPAPSSISLSHIMPSNPSRPMPSSYHAPPASTLQRVPSLPKRRGVRFAPSVTPRTSPTSLVDSSNTSSQSSANSIAPPPSFERGHARHRSGGSSSPLGGPVVIVHPSSPADELEIDQPPPSPGSRGLVSTFGKAGPKQRAPFPRGESELEREERERAQRERDEKERERERRRKSSILQAQQAQVERQRLQEEVIATRKRRESYRLDGGSTSVRAQAAVLTADSSSLSYSSGSTNSSSQNQYPRAPKRTSTDPGPLGGSLGRQGRCGQMWDLAADDVPPLPTSSSVKSPTGEMTWNPRRSSIQGGATMAPRPSSLRSIAMTHGTSTGASGQHPQANNGSKLRNMTTNNLSRTSLPTGAANDGSLSNGGAAVNRRSAPVPGASGSLSGTGAGLSASLSLNGRATPAPAKSSGTTIPLPSSGGGLPRRRSLVPGDPSLSQRPGPQTRNSRESSHFVHGHGAPLTAENVRARSPSPPPQTTGIHGPGVPYGMQMPMAVQMPMFVVQPIAVPMYVPMPTAAAAGASATTAHGPVPTPAGAHRLHQRMSSASLALPRSKSQSSGLTRPPPSQPIKHTQ